MPKYVQQFSVLKDELTVYIPPSGVVPVLTFLRDHSQCQFKSLVDISGADYPEREKRFEVVYHLLSLKYSGRMRVKTYANEVDPVPSATSVFRGADWYVSFSCNHFPTITYSIGTNARSTICMVSSSLGTPTCMFHYTLSSLDLELNRIFRRRILTDYGQFASCS